MKRRHLVFLIITLPAVAVFLWQGFWRPYDGEASAAAPCRIDFARLTRDQGYHWLEIRLDITTPAEFQLDAGLRLVTADGRVRSPAGLTLEGTGAQVHDFSQPSMAVPEAITIKFWLEPGDLDGPLSLAVGQHQLRVRTGETPPELENQKSEIFRNSAW